MTKLRVNGRDVTVDAEPDTPLLWVLRDHLGLTGTKFGCGVGLCGACTVHVDGAAIRACITAVADVAGARSDHRGALAPTAAIRCRRPGSPSRCPQCGYCQPGMIMTAAALLGADAGSRATPTSTPRCRPTCAAAAPTTAIRRAIHRAAAAERSASHDARIRRLVRRALPARRAARRRRPDARLPGPARGRGAARAAGRPPCSTPGSGSRPTTR